MRPKKLNLPPRALRLIDRRLRLKSWRTRTLLRKRKRNSLPPRRPSSVLKNLRVRLMKLKL